MINLRVWINAVAGFVATIAAASLPATAEVLYKYGKWRLGSTYNNTSGSTLYVLGSLNLGDESTWLSLSCRDPGHSSSSVSYSFIVEGEAFKAIPFGTSIKIIGRRPDGQPYDYWGQTTGTGKFVIS